VDTECADSASAATGTSLLHQETLAAPSVERDPEHILNRTYYNNMVLDTKKVRHLYENYYLFIYLYV
jgi:hypothetical protein